MGWALFFLNGLIFSSKQLRNLNVFVYIFGKNHRMKPSEFVNKFKSRYLWGNLAAMAVVGVLLCIAVKYCLDVYTHHGEAIVVPDVRNKLFADAERILADAKLRAVVNDTGYVKTLPPDCVLSISPESGERVKAGRVVYITINSPHTPTITLPDLIDNSSLREAMAKLSAMGFRLAQPQRVNGEKDWVYGITVNGRNVVAGDKIPIDARLVIQVGDGMRDETDDISVIDLFEEEEMGEVDEFEEVSVPPATEPATGQPPVTP